MSIDIKVMTRNLYLGADLQPVIDAVMADRPAVPRAAAAVLEQFHASDFPARAECIAAEIAAHRPHVVGLQEAFLLRHRKPSSLLAPPFKELPAGDVVFDYERLLLDRLAARGVAYTSIVTTMGNDNQAPAGTPPDLEDVRVTDREVILLRGDLAEPGFGVLNAGAHVFAARMAYGPFRDIRTWAHVDLTIGGRALRIASTHLQLELSEQSAALQVAQAEELIAVHARRRDPLVIMGDFNSRPDGSTTATYRRFMEAGYRDAWIDAGDGPGFTCKPEELRDPARTFDQRIDFVLHRNGLNAVDAVVTGSDPANRTPSGLWPSDHGGVVATLRLEG